MTERPATTADDAQTHLDHAYRDEEQGEYENALHECDAAIRSAPNLPEAHNLRGIVLEEMGRKREAIEAYREALRLDPHFSNATKNMAELEKELLLSLLGKERTKRIYLLRVFGLVCRVLAWVFLSVQVLKLLATVYVVTRQGQYYYGYPNGSLEMLASLLPSVLEIVINGAVYFAIMFVLSLICVEITEPARRSVHS